MYYHYTRSTIVYICITIAVLSGSRQGILQEGWNARGAVGQLGAKAHCYPPSIKVAEVLVQLSQLSLMKSQNSYLVLECVCRSSVYNIMQEQQHTLGLLALT